MKDFTENLLLALNDELYQISLGENTVRNLEASVLASRKALIELREYISTYKFNYPEEEIKFFKTIKPAFYSKFIYFIDVYNIETNRPECSDASLKMYYREELASIKRFFDHNHLFYYYYRSEADYLDNIYFTRGIFNIHGQLDDFEHNDDFSTSHDYKLSKIISNEQLRKYLTAEIFRISQLKLTAPVEEDDTDLEWTSSKNGLIELLYAFHAAGVFNNGSASIRQLAGFMTRTFKVKLGDYYRLFQDFRIRKKDRTKFLNYLIERLTARMDEMDE